MKRCMHESHREGEPAVVLNALEIPFVPTLTKPGERLRRIIETALVVAVFAALAAAGVQLCVRVLP